MTDTARRDPGPSGDDHLAELHHHAGEVAEWISQGEIVTAARSTAAKAAALVGAERSAFFIRDGAGEEPRFVLAAAHRLDKHERPMLEAAVERGATIAEWLAGEPPGPAIFYSARSKWVCVPIRTSTAEAPVLGALATALPDSSHESRATLMLVALARSVAAHYRRRFEELRTVPVMTSLSALWTAPPPKSAP
ncbi:hypothetical protein L6R52_42325 [Myxococcota bacterium]|nr:hypothetical protein [Myxococcota bacterium]